MMSILRPESVRILAVFLSITLSVAVESAYSATPPANPGPGESMQVTNAGCIEDVTLRSMRCTANDIKIARVTNIEVLDDGCTNATDTVTFSADFEISLEQSGGVARHDLGVYISTDGDPDDSGARKGQCTINTLPYRDQPRWLDLDGRSDSRRDAKKKEGEQDTCGDIDASISPAKPTYHLTVKCADLDDDGKLNLPYCLSWQVPGDKDLCTRPTDATPTNRAKCRCDDAFEVNIPVPPAGLLVTKTPDKTVINEPGDKVTFTITVVNSSITQKVTLTNFTDSIFGNVALLPYGIDVLSSTCKGDILLSKNDGKDEGSDTYSCHFTAFERGQPGKNTNTITVTGRTASGETITGVAQAEVQIADVGSQMEVEKTALTPQIQEPGQEVTFNVVVRNLSPVDKITLTSLTDTRPWTPGDSNPTPVDLRIIDPTTDCVLPQTLEPFGKAGGADEYRCSFTVPILGPPGKEETDLVIASGHDDDGFFRTANDPESVTIVDLPASFIVTKAATPEFLDEPGGPVTYTITVRNTSAVDTITIDSIHDSLYGAILEECIADGFAPRLEPNATGVCRITRTLTSEKPHTFENRVVVTAIDDDGATMHPVAATESIQIADILPKLLVEKTASPLSVPETGGDVTFTVTVRNRSTAEPVTLSSLMDSLFDLHEECPATEVTLSPMNVTGDAYHCSFTRRLEGDAGVDHFNTVTAVGADDEGNLTTATDSLRITFEDEKPKVAVSKIPSPSVIPEAGASVTFRFETRNLGDEDITLTSMTDSSFGSLDGHCGLPRKIVPEGSSLCEYVTSLSGTPGVEHRNALTVTVVDDDGNEVSESASAAVQFLPSTPTPTATATATATATPTVTATATATATATPTATATATSTPTVTATPTPTVTAIPTSTVTPTATAPQTATLTSTAAPSPSLPPVQLDCFGVPGGAATVDACGVCGGKGDCLVGAATACFEEPPARDAVLRSRAVMHAARVLRNRTDRFAKQAKGCSGAPHRKVVREANRILGDMANHLKQAVTKSNTICPRTTCSSSTLNGTKQRLKRLATQLFTVQRGMKLTAIRECKVVSSGKKDNRKSTVDFYNDLNRAIGQLPKTTKSCT